MKLNFTNRLLPIFALLLTTTVAWSQIQTPLDIALRHIEQNYQDWNLTANDVRDMGVSNQYKSDHNGVTHIYFIQRHEGIEVYNAIMNVNVLPEGEILNVGSRFIPNLSTSVNTVFPGISAADAVQAAAEYLELYMDDAPRMLEQISTQEFVFGKDNISNVDIPVKLKFQALEDGTVRLAWDLSIDVKGNPNYWSMRVDAFNGEVLDQNNYTVFCQFEDHADHSHTASCGEKDFTSVKEALIQKNEMLTDSAQYRVFPVPAESPAHGVHTLVVDPHNPTASPYGWHDVNGEEGAEFTITRGNNVHAYPDWEGVDFSTGGEPDGGADLIFDFPYSDTLEPLDQAATAIVNLFYMNNMIHDFTYQFGFTEAAGNFQSNNYGNGGAPGDFVNAEAQDGINTGNINNANFATPPDGGNGRMQMFAWDRNGAGALQLLTVDAPASIAGPYPASTSVDWGQTITSDNPVSGEVVIVNDGVSDPFETDGCEPILNGTELEGKIALIDRGGCQFGFKALAAEEQGAIGVIICNFEDAYVNMGAGTVGNQVTIPAIFLSVVDCQLIRQYVGDGLEVTLVAPEEIPPNQLDGDFDNGIIAHEYAHGLSNRLTGGPNQAGCLSNAEQMGEGWSDFLTLIMGTKPGDVGEMRKGVGTFVRREPNDGRGIRTYPYSNDMDVNPHTYGDVPNLAVPHGLGSVWCAMLWDMYWAFSDTYGWSEDWTDMSAGNNIAIQLVMDGMKMQTCGPGFVDGRNAILEADTALTGGENGCLIWEVFARRGLGYSADQGDPNNSADGIEAFDVHPLCIPELKITKEVTEFILPGDIIDVTLTVVNHRDENLTNVVVTDEIPDGTSFVVGSSNLPFNLDGNMVTFDVGDMAFLDEVVITYQLSTPQNQHSIEMWKDDVLDANAEDNWDYYFIGDIADNIWQISDIFSNSPDYSWEVQDIETESRQALELVEPYLVEGTQPVLRFYHYYNTEVGFDGGVIDFSIDDGDTWFQVGDKMFKNGYPSFIAYGTFVVPNFSAWSGNSGGFIPTYIDLSDYIGEELKIRYRFGTDEMEGGLGWWVDDIEFMDMLNYNGEACVTSDQGDMACDIADSRGTIVESAIESNVIDPESNVEVAVYPNPANANIYVSISAERQEDVSISLMTVDGKVVTAQKIEAYGTQTLPIAVDHLPSGFYFVKVSTDGGMMTEKIVVH